MTRARILADYVAGGTTAAEFDHIDGLTSTAVGYTYDKTNDVFILPQPYSSWSLDSNFDWQPPTAMPDDGKEYDWDEDKKTWNQRSN